MEWKSRKLVGKRFYTALWGKSASQARTGQETTPDPGVVGPVCWCHPTFSISFKNTSVRSRAWVGSQVFICLSMTASMESINSISPRKTFCGSPGMCTKMGTALRSWGVRTRERDDREREKRYYMMQKKKNYENTILSSNRGQLLTACGLPEVGIQFLDPGNFESPVTACWMSHHRSQNALQRQWCRLCCRQHYLDKHVHQKIYLKMEMETKPWSSATPSCWTSSVSNENRQMLPWWHQEKKPPHHSKHHTRKWRSSHSY